MKNTANKICRCIVALLEAHGVRRVVASPGSRNAPLLIALSRSESIHSDMVVDERSAGFIALGYSTVAGEAVALVCTSGTALLNYAPAIAEAYYRKAPLIVISADRPGEWIGQDDSQTIRQPGALDNFVKRSYDIPPTDSKQNLWFANRIVNDALLTAISGRQGPVHINVQLSEPLGELIDESPAVDPEMIKRKISMIRPQASISVAEARELGRKLASPRRVMIVAGFMNPDKTVNKALNRLSQLPNVVVLTETIANLHGKDFITCIDATLASMSAEKKKILSPDVVITMGGALVSRHLKQYLRDMPSMAEHWHVGELDDTIDCFQHLSLRIELAPSVFFPLLASAMQPHRNESDYAHQWQVLKNRAESLTMAYSQRIEWSDMKAFATLIPMIPRRWNVQFSNGTSIRYGQLLGNHEYHRCDCNRGVSGIDGSTSTAIGGAMAYKSDVTLLITGDMSAGYDVGALLCKCVPSRFKMVVINNQGGGIFRFIRSTSELDIREAMFCCNRDFNLYAVAKSVGFKCFSASSVSELRSEFPQFATVDDAPSMLIINTPAEISADVLKNYFEFCRTH